MTDQTELDLTPADRGRLARQKLDVLRVMQDGLYHTLRGISDATGWPEASVSARLRELRQGVGGRTITKRRRFGGAAQYEYRMEPKP